MSGDDKNKTSTETDTHEESSVTNCPTKKDSYYMASSNGPHLILTQVQLKDNIKDHNYDQWAKAMDMALRLKQKLGLIDSLILIPTDDPDKEEEW